MCKVTRAAAPRRVLTKNARQKRVEFECLRRANRNRNFRCLCDMMSPAPLREPTSSEVCRRDTKIEKICFSPCSILVVAGATAARTQAQFTRGRERLNSSARAHPKYQSSNGEHTMNRASSKPGQISCAWEAAVNDVLKMTNYLLLVRDPGWCVETINPKFTTTAAKNNGGTTHNTQRRAESI